MASVATPHMDKVKVPLLSAGNWGGPGVHLRGNVSGFAEAASQQKWLSMHIGTHFDSFYLPEYVAMQKRFFDRFFERHRQRLGSGAAGPHRGPRRARQGDRAQGK